MRSARKYEDDVGDLLDVFFANVEPATIRIRKNLKYGSETGYRSYSPIIDVSVGPFSETKGVQLWNDYDNLVYLSSRFIDNMLEQFWSNYRDFGRGFFEIDERTLPDGYTSFLSSSKDVNWNARCFMAIEVENRKNPKHLLGDMVNVSISGRIGVVIGYNQFSYEAFLRQLEYFAYTIEAKKLRFNSRNIIVLKPDQFETILTNNLEETR